MKKLSVLAIMTTLVLCFACQNPATSSPAAQSQPASQPAVTTVATPVFTVAGGTYTEDQSVSISSTSGATIRYTTDNSEPQLTGGTASDFTGPILLNSLTTLKAKAFKTGLTASATATATYTFKVAKPKLDVPAGSYTEAKTVGLASDTPGATIYYTIDTSSPSTSSASGNSVTVSSPLTLRVIAVKAGYANSDETSAVYIITLLCDAAVPNVVSGTYQANQAITLTCASANSAIRYTVNGSAPSGTVGTLYAGETINITATTTLRTFTYLTVGIGNSGVIDYQYTLKPALPTISVPSGTYNTEQTTNIACSSTGVDLYYTTNGATPNASSTPVPASGNLAINGNTNLRVIAMKTGWSSSEVVAADYVLKPALPTISVPSGTYNTEQTTNIACGSTGVDLYYTTNGTTPNASSTPVPASGDLAINGNTNLRVIAMKTNWSSSEVAVANYILKVPTPPVIALASGDLFNSTSVGVSSAFAGTTMYYTTNDTTPTTASAVAISSVTLNGNAGGLNYLPLKVIAAKPGWTDSDVASASYVFKVSPVSFTIADGFYASLSSYSMTTSTSGATIYWTNDNSDPNSSIKTWTGLSTLQENFGYNFRVVAKKSNYLTSTETQSHVVSQTTNRTFRAANMTTSAYYNVSATRQAYNDKVVVYVEDAMAGSFNATAATALATEFKNNIYAPITANFAAPYDIDDTGRTILLVLDIKDGYVPPSGGFVGGYFSGGDFNGKTYFADSNEADMLYLDAYPSTADVSGMYSTAAHEFQHLVNFSKNVVNELGNPQDVWINEGLSAGAEYVYRQTRGEANPQVTDRIDWFNGEYSGAIKYGNNFYIWDGGFWETAYPFTVLDNYATAYLFFQWLRIHASNGVGVYKDIMNHAATNYTAVLDSVRSRFPSYSSAQWKNVMQDWYVANAAQYTPAATATTGIHGYGPSFPQLVIYKLNNTYTSMEYDPGEAVFISKTTSGAFAPAANANASYVGLTQATMTADFDGADGYTGDVILCSDIRTTMIASRLAVSLPLTANILTSYQQTKPSAVIKISKDMKGSSVGNKPYRIDAPISTAGVKGTFKK